MADLSPLPAGAFDVEAAAHLLGRAGFGGTWDEARELAALGVDSAVSRFVDFERSTLAPPPCAVLPDQNDRVFEERLRGVPEDQARAARERRQKQEQDNIRALQIWWLERMLASSPFHETCRPLEERLTLFWHSHFASSFEEKIERVFPLWRQNQTFRELAVQPFVDQLNAVIRDPAMLVWLDNASSHRGNPNENFARELMELFSTGVGPYSEKDVKELARALTGYGVDRDTWTFVFRADAHDPAEKTFFGQTGPFDGSDAALVLCEQPATARFLAGKLLREFVTASPGGDLVEAVAAHYRSGGYNLRETLRMIFSSREFYAPSSRACVIKGPVVLTVGALKSMRTPLPAAGVILGSLAVMGQRLFFPPDVNGWPGGEAWINSNTLLVRYNFSNYLLHGVSPDEFQIFHRETDGREMTRREFVEGQRNPDAVLWEPRRQIEAEDAARRMLATSDIVDYFLREFLPRKAPPNLRDALMSLAEMDAGGGRRTMTLRDRNFDERARNLVHLIMSSPDYQLC